MLLYCFSYTKDFNSTRANIKFQIKTEVDVFNDSEYESFFMRDNNYVPSVPSSTCYNINSHIENKHTNFDLKIESSTETYMPTTKHKVIKSEQKNQIKNKVNVIDNAVVEKHVIHNDKYRPSVESTTCGIKSHVEINPRNFNHSIKASTKTLTPTKHKTITYEENTQIKTEIDIIDDTMYESFFMRDDNYVPSVVSSTCYGINSRIKNNRNNNCHLNIKDSTKTFIPTKKKFRTLKENSEKPYKCYICNTFFSWKGNMKIHMEVHTGEKPYRCFICNKSYARLSTLYAHKIIHEFHKPFNCAICKKSFAQKSNLKTHINNKHIKLL